MEILFANNTLLLFFFVMITVFNYSTLKEYQRIAIIYITVYALAVAKTINTLQAISFIVLSLFCFLEILINDEMKFKLITNPIYKCIDCLYLSIFQYAFLEICFGILLTHSFNYSPLSKLVWFYPLQLFISLLFIIKAITNVLQQKFVIKSFTAMYSVFIQFPIQTVQFNDKLKEACSILIAIEDREYYQRNGYTFLSLDYLSYILKNKFGKGDWGKKIYFTIKNGKRFMKNVLSGKRGYSTIPMQLIRSLGIEKGYNYAYRRKIFEFIYSKIFFDGLKKLYKQNQVAKRTYIKEYILYIYFHSVNTFLGDITFSKFLNAFDLQYSQKNQKDIYDCSNEGIFIACMGLSKRATLINEYNVDYYIENIPVPLDKIMICNMVENMMSKPYDGQYLK